MLKLSVYLWTWYLDVYRRQVFEDSKYWILSYRTSHYITSESVKRSPCVIWDPRKPAQNPVYNCLVIKLFCRTGYHLGVSESGRVRGLSATNEPHGNINGKILKYLNFNSFFFLTRIIFNLQLCFILYRCRLEWYEYKISRLVFIWLSIRKDVCMER